MTTQTWAVACIPIGNVPPSPETVTVPAHVSTSTTLSRVPGKEQDGTFMPMSASDGPHYGANIKMMGAAKYKLTFTIDSPEKQGYLLHVDEETGVPGRFWKKPLEVNWEFSYLPRKF